MTYQASTRHRVLPLAVLWAMVFVVLLVLGSSTVLAQGAGTPTSESGSPDSSAGTSTASDGTPVPEPGPPRYPDLVALPPDDLYFSTELLDDGRRHRLLRFSTSVSNIGEGPLELAGSTDPVSAGDVYQVIYDAPTNGTAAEEHDLGTDLIYHPEHFHFHLDSFATFELLREEREGDLVPTGEGGKQSSCLLDTLRMRADVPPGAPPDRYYYDCEIERQGISVGWQDVYAASLPDQWVDLGAEPLADGAYVLRYSVDPLDQIAEDGRRGNNVSETRFTVREGEIVGRPEPPRCMLQGDAMGPVGTTVTLRCSHFPDDSEIALYWDSWDPWDSDAEPIATFSSRGAMATTGRFQVPDVPPGSYTIAVVAPDFDAQIYVSATVIYGVQPGDEGTPEAGHGDG